MALTWRAAADRGVLDTDPFQPFLDQPDQAAVLTDFDGTLSLVVDDPAAAAPLPGVVEVLHRLARRYRLTGVVSGRPVVFLADRLGTDLWLSGLYGLEAMRDGRRTCSPEADRWRPVVAEVVSRARQQFGDLVEDKGLSLTVHFRTSPEREADVLLWAAVEEPVSGLVLRSAKASVELHPPVATDKGTIVESAAAGMAAACFLGDDVGDVPAFAALDRLAAAGTYAVRVGVRTPETPAEVLDRADMVVEGPAGALAVLELLAG